MLKGGSDEETVYPCRTRDSPFPLINGQIIKNKRICGINTKFNYLNVKHPDRDGKC